MTDPSIGSPDGDSTLEHLADDVGVEPEELAEETGLEPDADEATTDDPGISTAYRGGE